MTSGDDYKNWTVVEEGKPDLVRLENFGDVTESVAVDIYVGGEVVRRILQPKDRTEGWSQENEDEFRKQARELATTYTDPDADDIILDPDTPNQKSIN